VTYRRFKIEETETHPAAIAAIAAIASPKESSPAPIAAKAAIAAGHLPKTTVLDIPPDVPEDWAQGVVKLLGAEPVEGFSSDRWRQTGEDAKRLLRDHGAAAARCGWSTLDLFGAHPVAPAARYDSAGLALLLRGGAVTEINAKAATISMPSGARLTFRRRDNRDGVPLWTLRTSGRTEE
jgi:hypothetical protein